MKNQLKLITLNIWGGQIKQPLLDFIKSNKDIDIFCLQEVYYKAKNKICTNEDPVELDILSEIQGLLPYHNIFFSPTVRKNYGIAICIAKYFNLMEKGDFIIHKNPSYKGIGPTHSRKLQWVRVTINDKIYTIMNMHGLWTGTGKTDTPERILQSRKIKNFINELHDSVILCGDFNLMPNTESLKILEEGMNNLIKSYNVESTRTRFYRKEEKFADYIFISAKIDVENFTVLKNEISDHAPLLLLLNL